MRYLLDKNVIRYALTGLRQRHLRPLSSLEVGALSFWRAATGRDALMFISHVSLAIMQPMRYREVQLFLGSVEVLFPTRYHQRWARRIRETVGLTREDAAMIALATFGSNTAGMILGAQTLLTYDRRMINGYLQSHSRLNRRLQAMTRQLPAPFHQAALPHLATPDEVLSEWSS